MLYRAVCFLKGSAVVGVIKFEQSYGGTGTRIFGEIRGLTDGLHGFHIHEWGDLTDGCESAGAHYNPFGAAHGGLDTKIRHLGDLGNVQSAGGLCLVNIFVPGLTLTGPYSVVGRSLIVHADVDDCGQGFHPLSKTTGNSGARVACGVIGLAK
jgi:Cu-Zn family superoxide dismutase